MKELTVFEMEEISGGAGLNFGDSIFGNIAAGALGGVAWACLGTLIGGTQSGANGGLVGFGLIGNAIGAIWGFIAGGIFGASTGFSLGWDKTSEFVENTLNNFISGKFVPWSQ